MIFWRFCDVDQCSDSISLKSLFWRFWGGGVRYRFAASILLDMIWCGVVCCLSWFFTCLSMLGLLIWNDCLHVWRHGESFGLVCCDRSSLLTSGLACSVRFGLPGMVSYGLAHLCWLIGPGLVCLVVFVCVRLSVFVLCWSGSPDHIPGQAWSCLLCSALPKSVLFALVCIGLVVAALLQAGLLSLISVPSCSLLVCSGLVSSALL